MRHPQVSIVLPTHNGSAFIRTAIQSVLAQTFTDWELLVIDDGSSDDTAIIVRQFTQMDERVRLIQNQNNLGLQKTLNKGLAMARGEYIARIDDDDTWCNPRKLELQVAFLDKYRDHVLVGTQSIIVNQLGQAYNYSMPVDDRGIRKLLLRTACFVHSSVMFRKNMALKVGGYPETEDACHIEDHAMWLRLGLEGQLAIIPLYATTYNARAESICGTHQQTQIWRDLILIKKFRKLYPAPLKSVLCVSWRMIRYQLIKRLPVSFVTLVRRMKTKYRQLKNGKPSNLA